MKKYDQKNNGNPIYVNAFTDLPSHAGDKVDVESWYINCAVEIKNRKVGFSWHQQAVATPFGKLHFTNLFLHEFITLPGISWRKFYFVVV